MQVVASECMPADRVLHLDGGVYRYAAAGMPMTGEYDGSNAGRTPNVAEKPTGAWLGAASLGAGCWDATLTQWGEGPTSSAVRRLGALACPVGCAALPACNLMGVCLPTSHECLHACRHIL